MSRPFVLPDLGEGLTEAEIVKILVREGDVIREDTPLLEVETDKATVEIPSPMSGRVEKIHVHPNETVREAINILREYAVSQMPVVKAEPPVTAGEVIGSVIEKELLDALFSGQAHLADPLERHMSAPLPIVGSGEPVSAATHALEKADAVLVHDEGKPAGVLTRQDLLSFLVSE
jgi:pyruvate/2-oxoglutarate dehydrogenase complex dihydrolipoamide acyltransferase (E2) component